MSMFAAIEALLVNCLSTLKNSAAQQQSLYFSFRKKSHYASSRAGFKIHKAHDYENIDGERKQLIQISYLI